MQYVLPDDLTPAADVCPLSTEARLGCGREGKEAKRSEDWGGSADKAAGIGNHIDAKRELVDRGVELS